MTDEQRDRVEMLLYKAQPKLVRHGDCVGADEQFHDIARGMELVIHVHPCNISSQRAWVEGAKKTWREMPPLDRNHVMVNMSRLLIATPGEEKEVLRSGTWATIRYARKVGRRTAIVFPDGHLKLEDERR